MYDANDPNSVVPPTLINEYSILTQPAYWRAVNFLADNLASFPRRVHKDAAALDVAHSLDPLLKRQPNGYQNGTLFWRTLFFHVVHRANGYARIERSAGMKPLALHLMPPAEVTPFRVVTDAGAIQQWYLHRPTKTSYPREDVIHLTGLSGEGMIGMDPIDLHARTFQRAITIDKYVTRFLMRGTVLRGAIQIPTGVSDDVVKEVRQMIRTQFQGVDAEDDVIILSDGATLNNATLTPQSSQLMEQNAYSTKQIAQVTGVPPHFLFDLTEGKYNGVPEQAGIDVVRYCFRPWIEQAEDELTSKLLTLAEQGQGLCIKLDPGALTRGDTKTTTDTTVQQTNAGLRTPNEGRAALGLPPDPDPASNKLRMLGDTNPKAPSAA